MVTVALLDARASHTICWNRCGRCISDQRHFLLQPELDVDYDRRHEMLEMSGGAVLQVRYYIDHSYKDK